MKQIYLDYNSTTPLDKRVLEVMMPYLTDKCGNASSVHHAGREAKTGLEGAREQVADVLGAEPSEIYFTSGGTESDNLALRGAAYYLRKKRNHIIVSSIEHHAVLMTAKALEKEGFAVEYLEVDRDGLVLPEKLREKVTDQTAIVSVMHVNNEVGSIQNISELSAIAHEKGALFHTDAVQSVGKISVNVEDLGIDLLALSGHKLCGPKGAGGLYVRSGVKITPLMQGGHHEKKRRPGTENIPAIVGLGEAIRLAEQTREPEHARLTKLSDYFIEAVQKRIPNVYLNGPRDERRMPSTVNLSFEYIEGESIILSLDLKGVEVASGSACTSGSLDPSHVLLAMGVSTELAQGSIRFSMGRFTTREDLEYTVSVLPEIIERLRSMSPLYHGTG